MYGLSESAEFTSDGSRATCEIGFALAPCTSMLLERLLDIDDSSSLLVPQFPVHKEINLCQVQMTRIGAGPSA